MHNAAVVGVLWAMSAATAWRLLFPGRGKRQRRPYSFLASIFGTLGLTLGLDPVYVALEQLSGERNWVDPAKHTCLILAALFLAFTVLTSVDRLSRRNVYILTASCVAALTIQSVAFAFIDATPSTTEFMQTFGREVPTVIYSASHFWFFGFTEVMAFFAALAVWRTGAAHYRVASVALGAAAGAAVLIVIVITVRDWSRLAGAESLAGAVDPIYKVLFVVIAVASCVGLGLPSLVGPWIDERQDRLASRTQDTLTPVLTRAKQQLGTIGLSDEVVQFQMDHLSPLRRTTIGLRDAEAMGFKLTRHERAHLRLAERLLDC